MSELLFNKSDYEILSQLINSKCFSPVISLTRKQLMELTGCSMSKIRNANKNFLMTGIIKEGTKDGNNKTYYITEEGIKHYQYVYNLSDDEIKKMIE